MSVAYCISGLNWWVELRHTVLVSDQYFTVEDLVVAQDVVEHLLVQALRWRLKGDFHATSLLDFEINVSVIIVSACTLNVAIFVITHGGSLFKRMPTASNSASSKARCSARFVASSTMRIKSLV